MEITMFPSPTLARCELEMMWRRRLKKSHVRYKTATRSYGRLIQQELDGHRPVPDSALIRARRAKTHALLEYLSVLQICTDLAFNGENAG